MNRMNPIFCCKGCIAPKRHPGCHDHCPEYQKEKTDHEARKAVADKKKFTDQGIYLQRSAAVTKAMRGRRLSERSYARGIMNKPDDFCSYGERRNDHVQKPV